MIKTILMPETVITTKSNRHICIIFEDASYLWCDSFLICMTCMGTGTIWTYLSHMISFLYTTYLQVQSISHALSQGYMQKFQLVTTGIYLVAVVTVLICYRDANTKQRSRFTVSNVAYYYLMLLVTFADNGYCICAAVKYFTSHNHPDHAGKI